MISLYDAFVPSCLQLLGSVSGLIEKSKAHCDTQSIPPESLIEAKLAPDMFDFAYQVKSCAVHSIGAIEGVQKGSFSPDFAPSPSSFEGLEAKITDAIAGLKALSVADVEALSDKSISFTIKDKLLWTFVGKDFLLSFSQPNFYFHATTTYNILRMSGVSIGKRDFLGAVRSLP